MWWREEDYTDINAGLPESKGWPPGSIIARCEDLPGKSSVPLPFSWGGHGLNSHPLHDWTSLWRLSDCLPMPPAPTPPPLPPIAQNLYYDSGSIRSQFPTHHITEQTQGVRPASGLFLPFRRNYFPTKSLSVNKTAAASVHSELESKDHNVFALSL